VVLRVARWRLRIAEYGEQPPDIANDLEVNPMFASWVHRKDQAQVH
jgi:hypothetical protein